MGWLHIKLKHNDKIVEISKEADENAIFGRSFIDSKSFQQALKHCNEYAIMLANKHGYDMVVLGETN